MNILFVDQFTQPGGAQQCLMDLLPEVLARRWNARLIAPGDGELARCCREFGIPVHPLPLGDYASGGKTPRDMVRFAFEVPRMRRAVRRVVAQHGIDLVCANGPRVLPAVNGIGRPVIFHAHSPIAGTLPRMIAEMSVRRADATVIAVSEFVSRRYPKSRVIYNGVPDYGGSTRTFGGRPPRVGIVGRIAPEKGHLDFVRVAIAIARVAPDARFLVYGERLFSGARYDREVRAAAKNAPVEFCGWKKDVGKVMRELDILVVPSDPSEAATRVIMEAFSAGTPVVAYGCGGIPELVEDGRTGLLVDWPDAGSLARRILSLLADPAAMERLSIAARSEWNRRFRIGMFRQHVCDVMRDAAGVHTSEPRDTASSPVSEHDTRRV
jgi:glycosyltransferase involved in cell wall biosynthesis